jgi:lysophospholipase L1-like esterase
VLLLAGSAAAILLAEGLLWATGLPSESPFLQEFYGSGFKLMCYDANPSGALDIDLRDPRQREPFATRFEHEGKGPGFEAHWRKTPFAVEVRFNSMGFRDDEFAPRREGVRRIVVVGDSLTYGHGLPEADSYPRRLEGLLQAARPHEPVEVYNVAGGGHDLARIARTAAFALEHLEPDVLIYGYFLNDPLRHTADYGDGIEPMLDASWQYRELEGFRFSLGGRPRTAPRIVELARRAFESRRLTEATLAWYREIHEAERWAPTGRTIADMGQRARERGTRFVLLLLPVIWKLDGHYPFEDVHAGIVAHAREQGIDVVDALPVLRGHPDADLMLHPRDRHPNPKYTRLVAEALASAL